MHFVDFVVFAMHFVDFVVFAMHFVVFALLCICVFFHITATCVYYISLINITVQHMIGWLAPVLIQRQLVNFRAARSI